MLIIYSEIIINESSLRSDNKFLVLLIPLLLHESHYSRNKYTILRDQDHTKNLNYCQPFLCRFEKSSNKKYLT